MIHSELNLAFESLVKPFLARHPEIQHEWRLVKSSLWGDRLDLICGAGTPNEVFATLHGHQIALGLTTGDHEDFEDFGRRLTDADVAAEAFARFVELLSEHGLLSPQP